MITFGLSAAEKKEYEELLLKPHWVFVRIHVLDLDHNYLEDISNMILEGQVDVDTTAEVSRTLTMSIYDRYGAMDIDANSPNQGAMFMDKMIRIHYCIAPPDRSKWFEVPLFTGAITKADGSSNFIGIEAAGKEHLMYVSVWTPKTYKQGKPKVDAMIDILKDFGETKFKIKKSDAKLPKNVAVNNEKTPWIALNSIAQSMTRDAFYDARGVFQCRPRNNKRVYTFKQFTAEPQFSFSVENVINAVRVVGGKPKGAKKKITYRIRASRNHPLSPWKLGRKVDGQIVPRHYMAVLEDNSIKTKAEAKKLAKRRLDQGLLESLEASFSAPVVPHLEDNDVVGIETEDFSAKARFQKASIPLVGSAVMTVGYNKRISPTKKKVRRNKK